VTYRTGYKQQIRSPLLLDDVLSSSSVTGSSGGNETRLLTWTGESVDGRSMTDMLMVTTTVGMLDGVHSDTSDLWPVLSLIFKFEFGCAGLQEWLVSSATSRHDADHGSADAWDGLSLARGESHSGLGAIIGVTDDGGAAATGSGEGTSVSDLLFNVTNGGTFWDLIYWEDVARVHISF